MRLTFVDSTKGDTFHDFTLDNCSPGLVRIMANSDHGFIEIVLSATDASILAHALREVSVAARLEKR